MKNFNLEEAKAGHPVCTRSGLSVQILKFDLHDNLFPIVGIITHADGTQLVETFTKTGSFINAYDHSEYDLMMTSEHHEGWINIVRFSDRNNGVLKCPSTKIYPTKEEALVDAKCDDVSLGIRTIYTAKIEWEE